MKQSFRTSFKTSLSLFLTGAVLLPAAAFADSEKKSVVIDNGHTRVIIRTDEDNARRLKKMLKNSDRVVIQMAPRQGYPYGYYGYPPDYYPYYNDKGPAYSAGHAVGTLLSD